MNYVTRVLSISLLCIASCSAVADKNAMMMEMVNDPLAWMFKASLVQSTH